MHFLIVDFEFTMHQRYGRRESGYPEIIEVGAVVADKHGVLQDTVYNALVKPQFWPRISEDCTGITGIRQRDIEQGISFEQMLHSLWQMSPTQDTWLVGWGNQDRLVLKNGCDKYGFEYIDLATEYKRFNNRN